MSHRPAPPQSTCSQAAEVSVSEDKDLCAQLAERLYLLMDKAIDRGWRATMCLAVLLAVLGAIVVAVATVARG